MAEKLISMSVRLTEAEHTALQAIADRIGNGATVTGVIRQLVKDRISEICRCTYPRATN